MSHNEEESGTRRPLPLRWLMNGLHEIGIIPVFNSSWDTKLLMLQRFVRLFAYGASTLILATHLGELGITQTAIGLFMTLTLAGDVAISFCLTLVADSLGRRTILAIGALLMAISGVVFAITRDYWILLLAAILGVITPSGNEIGPFRAVEESIIAHLTSKQDRPSIFAWYSLIGTLGSATGLMVSGWLTTLLIEKKDWTPVDTYQLVFYIYAAVGLVKFVLALLLSVRCEADKPEPVNNAPAMPSETAPLLNGGQEDSPPKKKAKPSLFSMLPQFSKESRSVLLQLCLLFALDSFASGLAPLSWVTYYFKHRFSLREGSVGTLFSVTAIISALSILVAASIARRIGNVRTMVFTHLPSAVCLALVGLPSQLPLAMVLVLLRACTQSMDIAPRSAFLAAVVLPGERTATMGTINVVKTISQSVGPLITGILFQRNLFWVAFLTAGSLKVIYDLGMLLVFVGHKTREDREEERVNSQN